jgi:probable HAF family extracellular repeat protein
MRAIIRPRALCVCGVVSSFALSSSTALAALPKYHVRDIGTLGGATTHAADLNDAGQVTGYSETADGELRGFIYSRGSLRDLGTLGGDGSLGSAINTLGQVAGFAVTPTGHTRAVVYSNGSIIDLALTGGDSIGNDINNFGHVVGQRLGADGRNQAFAYIAGVTIDFRAPAGFDSYGTAINDAGQVLGTFYDKAGSHAFLFSLGVKRNLVPGKVSSIYGSQSLNAAGQVTGSYLQGGVTHGFVYQNGRVTDIGSLGGGYSFGFGLNAKGDVTGVSARADNQRHAFIYSGGRMSDVGTLGGTTSFGYAINAAKQVAGESTVKSGVFHAFVYSQGRLTDLGAAIETLHGRANVESVAYGINNLGQVIGRYYVEVPGNPGQIGFRSFLATPILQLFDGLERDVSGVGPGKSLQNKVAQAKQGYSADNKGATCSSVSSLQKEIAAQAGRKIPMTVASALQNQAAAIAATLGCG